MIKGIYYSLPCHIPYKATMSTVLLNEPALSLLPKENYKSLTLQNKLTNLKPKLKDLEV